MAQQEIKSLTGLRGIAALWVVYLHYGSHLKLDSDTSVFALVFNRLRYNGIVAVDIFFILSALVMCLAYYSKFAEKVRASDYRVFLKKRFIRIYPAYIFWLFMYLAMNDFMTGTFPALKILVNSFLIQNFFFDLVVEGIFWSLCAEWILYLIFPYLFRFSALFKSVIFFKITLLVCITVYFMLLIIPNYAIDFETGLVLLKRNHSISIMQGFNSILRCFLSYAMGISVFFILKATDFCNKYRIKAGYYACLLLFLSLFPVFGENGVTYGILVFCSLILVAYLYIQKHNDSFFNNRILYFLGLISYSLYVSHMFILLSLSILAKKLLGAAFLEQYQPFIILSSLILVIPISYLSYIIIEKQGGALLKKLLLKKEISKPKKAW